MGKMMPDRAPKTDKWTARENNQKKSGIFLIVSGLVQVTGTSKTPGLTEAIAPGRKTKTLILDLSIETGNGAGNDVLVWKSASYHKKVTANRYAGVDIHWDGKSIATCKVLDDGEHHQHLVKLTQAANAKFAKKPKTATAKPKVAPVKAENGTSLTAKGGDPVEVEGGGSLKAGGGARVEAEDGRPGRWCGPRPDRSQSCEQKEAVNIVLRVDLGGPENILPDMRLSALRPPCIFGTGKTTNLGAARAHEKAISQAGAAPLCPACANVIIRRQNARDAPFAFRTEETNDKALGFFGGNRGARRRQHGSRTELSQPAD